jgi:hypothetical protein
MPEGMGGKHEFRIHVYTNDAEEPEQWLTVYSDWIP